MRGKRRRKAKRRIVVGGCEYCWHAKGDDGYITIWISPTIKAGPGIRGNLRYHETWIDQGSGILKSAGDQIVITSRIIRRVIDFAIAEHGYDPTVKGKDLNLKVLDDVIKWDDAIRAGQDNDT